jgi:adenylate cyclase
MRDTFLRFEEIIAAHGGVTHEIRGDALVAEFPRASDAVSASVAFQAANTAHNETLSGDVRPVVRVGIAMGEVVIADHTITGEGVVMAQRLEQLAEPGGVCLQAAVYETVPKRLAFDYENLGEQQLKGFDEPVRAYAIKLGSQTTPAPDSAPHESGRPSIAILPFVNMSDDSEQEYFADGITEDIITDLSKLAGLLVISRNSTFTYKGKTAKAEDICTDLGVRYVLEGSVRKGGQRVRITAQLIDGRSGGHVWAERYDRDLADIFAVQDDVTEKIVRALEVSLVPGAEAPITHIETASPEAYDYVLRGREQYRLFSKEGNASARALYEKAIEIDPAYAAAYAGLAEVWLHEWFTGVPDALDRGYELALKASSLNPSVPLVYEALGNTCLFRKQHEQAVTAAKQWLEVEPGNADAHANLAGALHFSGESQQSIPLIEKAMRLNPYYPFYYILYRGQSLMALERYEEALEAIDRSAAHNPDALPAHVYRAACLGLLDKGEHARDALTDVYRIHPGFSLDWVRTFLPYRQATDSERLIEGLRKAGLCE